MEWRSEFTFRVLNNLNSVIQFTVHSSNDNKLLGHLAVPLKSLSGQKLQENWFHLKKPGTLDKLSQARLYVKMQWIRSKVKLMKDMKATMLEELNHSEKQL